MKLVCDACGSKYSIADDRVAGKVFKIRCKKCSQVIIVRGALPIEAPAREPAPIGDWHVVIDGQQHGPFEREELLRRYAAGEVDEESFVWRDGMEEWAAFGAIAELRGESTRIEPASQAADEPFTSASASALAAPAHELFATSASGHATSASSALFASAPAATTSDSAQRRASGRAAGSSSAFVGSTSASAVPDDARRLLAERNENSVLFTLGNLARLASPAPSRAAHAPAGTEGSGLIDIRALASTFAAPSPKVAASVGSFEDLPVYAPTTFGEPIVLMPTASRGPDRKLMYVLFAAIAILAIVATVLVFVMMRSPDSTQAIGGGQLAALDRPNTETGTDDSTATGTSSNGTTNSAASSTGNGTTGNGTTGTSAAASTSSTRPTTSTSSTHATASANTRPTTTATASTRPTTATTNARPTSSTTSTRPTTSSTTSTRPITSTTSTTSTARPTTTTTSTTRPTTAPDRVQCEFSNYADKGCEVFRPTPSNTAASNLPDNLDRNAIATGLATIRAQVCGGRSSSRGDVSVQIKVNADGGVSGVTIKSSPDPALSSCVSAAAGKGTFAKTKRGASFGYVWRF